jgi:RNA polymerase sigma factor (sigma-70 family)
MTDWLAKFLSAEPGFEQQVVERYSERLMALARRHLPDRMRRRVDPEDVLQSVYRSFFRRLNDGRFSFEESHDVWRLLAAMTFHKTINAVKYHQRTRRDVRREISLQANDDSEAMNLAEVVPSDEDITVLFQCLEKLIANLPENYREIVVQRLEGKRIEEIAQAVNRSRRTVIRVLGHLQDLAAKQLESAE